MLFVSFTKGPGGFPYVFIITAKVPTLIPIDGITLFDHRVFVLGGDQEVLDGAATFEVSLDAIPTTDLFDTFTKTLCVGYDRKDPSPIHHHNIQTNHPINHNNFKIIGREGHHLSRYIKESIFIRVNNPSLNNNVGKFNLPHIWDRVLINTPGLKINNLLIITLF